ncbi:hypothetical protein SPSP110954_13040 [Sporolactobacillus spathodeae]
MAIPEKKTLIETGLAKSHWPTYKEELISFLHGRQGIELIYS